MPMLPKTRVVGMEAKAKREVLRHMVSPARASRPRWA